MYYHVLNCIYIEKDQSQYQVYGLDRTEMKQRVCASKEQETNTLLVKSILLLAS